MMPDVTLLDRPAYRRHQERHHIGIERDAAGLHAHKGHGNGIGQQSPDDAGAEDLGAQRRGEDVYKRQEIHYAA